MPRNAIPANADCRGGVFAARRFPRPSPPTRRLNGLPHAKIPLPPHFRVCPPPLYPPSHPQMLSLRPSFPIEYSGLNQIPPSPKTVATRRAASFMPCHLPMPYDTQWQHPATAIPANADCRGGVFAARRSSRPPPNTPLSLVLLPTFALPSPYQRRFILGFRSKTRG